LLFVPEIARVLYCFESAAMKISPKVAALLSQVSAPPPKVRGCDVADADAPKAKKAKSVVEAPPAKKGTKAQPSKKKGRSFAKNVDVVKASPVPDHKSPEQVPADVAKAFPVPPPQVTKQILQSPPPQHQASPDRRASALGSSSPAKAAASASAAGILEGVDDSADMMAFQGNSSAAALRAAKARFNTSRKCSGKAKSFEEGNESKMPKALAAAVAANPGKFFKLLVENNGTQQSLLVG